MLASNLSGLPLLHTAFASWDTQGREGLEQKLTLCTWEVRDVVLREGGAKGCVGSEFAKLCAVDIFETKINCL